MDTHQHWANGHCCTMHSYDISDFFLLSLSLSMLPANFKYHYNSGWWLSTRTQKKMDGGSESEQRMVVRNMLCIWKSMQWGNIDEHHANQMQWVCFRSVDAFFLLLLLLRSHSICSALFPVLYPFGYYIQLASLVVDLRFAVIWKWQSLQTWERPETKINHHWSDEDNNRKRVDHIYVYLYTYTYRCFDAMYMLRKMKLFVHYARKWGYATKYIWCV